ncbi:type IX secretion system periplasmic lipoprotein PorW/SprE [Draconibacterium halophilum]|uniref:Tetratricopeptide repeat protein n=1 Tax=Draconibacterium halophilum TaxID=2706887 RepID=A0A6C0R9N3_9BACT|nr:tetratricopeptide repeat protein [Draconibacterium halophilum]QIA06662.1 tetratricopeptide repeat protein [Draconibacterium halophilum]
MKKRLLHTIFLFLLVSIFAGCSTEKNTRASRTFHNVTSRYNVYFNANEAVKEGVATIEERIEDDFTRILPIYKESDPSATRLVKSDMDYAVVKCSKLIEIHSITKKPKRKKGGGSRKYQEFASQEEFNKWIDDSYLLMGKAYFYQHNFYAAIDNFSYVVRKYPDNETADEAQVWLVRAYTELERYIEANEVIQAIQAYDDFPKSLERDFAIATAFYYKKQFEYDNAIRLLDIAIDKTFWKKDKARLQYIVAQLYRELGQNEAAATAFKKVTKMNPDYTMAFNAMINAAGVFSGEGNIEDLKKQLNKMLRDKKNVDFRDQIYYALGNIFFREGNSDVAKDNYKQSVASSFKNQYQRALSSITLADIYFEDLNYRGAQSYYDSAMIIIDETYPNYENVSARYKSLSSLVDNILTVEREDSLQRVAQMPDVEREALIASLMKAEQERQRNMENLSMQGARSQGYYRSNRYRMGMGNSGGGGWYFYNPQTVTYGRVTFQQQWGRRTLEDDWRRSNKNTMSMEEGEEMAEAEEEEQRIQDPLKKEFYTQDLPLTDSLMTVSHERIRDALYNAGKIFKSEFEDYERSAEAFEELIERYPNNIYLLSAYFDLYDLYELMGDIAKSNYYRNLIISDYPNSKFAQFLQNPNFFVEMAAKTDSLNRLYQETFRNYKLGRYQNVMSLTGQMKNMEPDSVIVPKIDFMQMVADGVLTDVHNFEALLKGYLAQYPAKEPSPLAQEILTLIQDSTLTDYQKLVEMGYISEEIQNEELLPENFMADDEFGGKFSYDEDLLHYFVIAYPREDEDDIDLNRLKFDIANYNIDHYTKIDYDIETEYLDDKLAFVLVRSMTNKENALIYHGAIIRKASVFKTLQGIDYMNFVISSTNYRAVMQERSTADYMKFFVKNYSRFIRSNFSDDEMDISPEELMARAEAEDNALKERGTFVTVKSGPQGLYNTTVDTTQNFVIAVKDKGLSLRPLMRGFADFNRDEFRSWNLALQVKEVGDYQLLVIHGIPALNESMSYFRRANTTRSLFEPLGQSTYRNFLITDENLETLLDENKVDQYITFFRNNYIQRRASSSSSAAESQTTTQPTTTQAAEPLPAVEADDTSIEDLPYNQEIEGPHRIVFVIPAVGVFKDAFIKGIQQYNQSNFANSGFTIEEQQLDQVRQLIIVKGMEDQATARLYFSVVVRNRDLFDPLGTAQYRNFLISDENFEIFLREKNITDYMDFYKKVYLEK